MSEADTSESTLKEGKAMILLPSVNLWCFKSIGNLEIRRNLEAFHFPKYLVPLIRSPVL